MNLEETMQSIREFGDETLYILWTNADPVTANLMVFMYAENSMRYHKWDAITIIVWGATTKLVAEDELIQSRIRALQELGVHFSACITCAEVADHIHIPLHLYGTQRKAAAGPDIEI